MALMSVSCDKMKSLTGNSNTTPAYVDPITKFPAEIQGFAPAMVGRFKQNSAQKLFDVSGGVIGNAEQYAIYYRYADERYKDYYKISFSGYDLQFTVFKTTSPENAKKRIEKAETDTKKQVPKLKQCDPEYEANNETTGAMPDEIIKRVKHPKGGDIIIVRHGLFITGNCVSKDNRNDEINAYWTDGVYLINASSNYLYKPELGVVDGLPIIEDFVNDYVAAVK